MDLPTDKKPASESLKVTDKRLFTADGEIREEYRESVKPVDASAAPPPAAKSPQGTDDSKHEKKKRLRDAAENPGTPFSNFIESLVASAYFSLGALHSPNQRPVKPDLAAAGQMIDLISMLAEKTKGNLTEDEDDFLKIHLGELKLAFVQVKGSL